MTLDVEPTEEADLGAGRAFLAMQLAMAEHLPSLSELETEKLLNECDGLSTLWHTRHARLMFSLTGI